MSPQRGQRAAMEPVEMTDAAVEADGAEIGVRVLELAPAHEQARAEAVQCLHEHFPENQRDQRDAPLGHKAAEEAHGPLQTLAGGFDIAALEGQFADLAFDLRLR